MEDNGQRTKQGPKTQCSNIIYGQEESVGHQCTHKTNTMRTGFPLCKRSLLDMWGKTTITEISLPRQSEC
eukprot:15314460-Ditylum_brightwellii.AAC.1